MYLFVDSSSYIQVGLLNDDFKWEHYELIANRKGSQIIHSVIHSSLKDKGLKTRDLKGIFLANGPGSYTGIRVAEGFSQVLELEGIPVYSFYHFEVPHFCGIDQYHFFAQAFKGEVFQYSFNKGEEAVALLEESKFLDFDFSQEHLYHLEGEILEKELDCLYDVFKSKSSDIFSKVLARGIHRPPYYYRTVEKEFKLPH